MFRIYIAAATFVAMCAITLADAAPTESQRSAAAAVPAAAPTVQVYSNPG